MESSRKCILFFFMDPSCISDTLLLNVSPASMSVDWIFHIRAMRRGRIYKRSTQHDAQHAWTFVSRVSSGAFQHWRFQQQTRRRHANERTSTSANSHSFSISKQGGGTARYFKSGATDHRNFHGHFYNQRASHNGAPSNVAVACQSCQITQPHMLLY